MKIEVEAEVFVVLVAHKTKFPEPMLYEFLGVKSTFAEATAIAEETVGTPLTFNWQGSGYAVAPIVDDLGEIGQRAVHIKRAVI